MASADLTRKDKGEDSDKELIRELDEAVALRRQGQGEVSDEELNRQLDEVLKEDLNQYIDETLAFISQVNNTPPPTRKDDSTSPQPRTSPVRAQPQPHPQPQPQPQPQQAPPDPYAQVKAQFEAQWGVLFPEIQAAMRVKPKSGEQKTLVEEFERATNDTLIPLVNQAQRDSSHYPEALRRLPDARKRVAAVLAFDKANGRQLRYQDALAAPLKVAKTSLFPKGGAVAIAKRKEELEFGSNFTPLLAAMGKLEDASKKTIELVVAVEKAANDYLESARGKKGGEEGKEHRAKKSQICYEALRNAKLVRLALEVDGLGKPPWNPEQEAVAMRARAVCIFESGGKARPLPPGEAGTSGSWFVDAKVATTGQSTAQEATKSRFIFKPADTEGQYSGWEPNGGAVREVAAKAISDHVLASTGFDLGVSPTSLVSICNDQLPGQNGQIDDNKPPERIGAMQELAPNDGDLKKMLGKLNPNAQGHDANAARQIRADLAALPTAELGKVVWADFLTINCDRHPGNVLIDRANKKLVPIDHGKSMPPSLDVIVNSREERRQKCALMHFAEHGLLPQVDQKLPDDMVARINLHDPAAMARKVKAQRDALKGPGHGADEGAMADKLSDESIDLSARSAYFFKVASKELTIRQLMQAQNEYLHIVLCADQANLDAAVSQVIAKVQANSRAQTALIQMFNGLPGDESQLLADIDPLGWSWQPGKNFDLFAVNPQLLLKIVTKRLLEPKKQAERDQLLADLKQRGIAPPPNLASLTIRDQGVALTHLIVAADKPKVCARAQELKLDPAKQADLDTASLDLLNDAPLKAAGIDPKGMKPKAKANKVKEVLLAEYEDLGGDNELDKAEVYFTTNRKTPLMKLNSLKAWIEFQKFPLPASLYQVGLAPGVGSIIVVFENFMAALALDQLDQAN
jgi:hypothetical protein